MGLRIGYNCYEEVPTPASARTLCVYLKFFICIILITEEVSSYCIHEAQQIQPQFHATHTVGALTLTFSTLPLIYYINNTCLGTIGKSVTPLVSLPLRGHLRIFTYSMIYLPSTSIHVMFCQKVSNKSSDRWHSTIVLGLPSTHQLRELPIQGDQVPTQVDALHSSPSNHRQEHRQVQPVSNVAVTVSAHMSLSSSSTAPLLFSVNVPTSTNGARVWWSWKS